MDERAQISSEAACFDAALMRYLSETRKRERRRRSFERGRWAVLLIASLLACQWPDIRSDAADAAEQRAKQRTAGLAAFACPHLEALLTEHALPEVSLERLRFAGDFLVSQRWQLSGAHAQSSMVPPHIGAGTRVAIMTADGSYVERAKD